MRPQRNGSKGPQKLVPHAVTLPNNLTSLEQLSDEDLDRELTNQLGRAVLFAQKQMQETYGLDSQIRSVHILPIGSRLVAIVSIERS